MMATLRQDLTLSQAPARLSPARLSRIVRSLASSPAQWRSIVQFTADHRWYYRLGQAEPSPDYEVWLLSWLPGQETGFHDHGDAAGAFAVADGELQEVTGIPGSPAVRDRVLTSGTVRAFGAAHVHDVRNISAQPAVSVHAYSPPLSAMRRYELTSSGLALTRTDTADTSW
jgi:predicted metal-dependent enzyme (double-stranded beta helix superfamily)